MLLTTIFSQNIFPDSGKTAMDGGIVDYGIVLYHSGKKWKDEFTPKEWAGEIVIKVFTNKLSGQWKIIILYGLILVVLLLLT
jgi:hypothetical protein